MLASETGDPLLVQRRLESNNARVGRLVDGLLAHAPADSASRTVIHHPADPSLGVPGGTHAPERKRLSRRSLSRLIAAQTHRT